MFSIQHFQGDFRQDQWSKRLFKHHVQKTEMRELTGNELPDTTVLSFDFLLPCAKATSPWEHNVLWKHPSVV